MLQAPPVVWFLVGCAGVAFLLRQAGGLTWLRGVALIGILLAVTVPAAIRADYMGEETFWSPYYAVQYKPARREISVNTIGHQAMVPYAERGSVYSLLHLLNRASGGAPFKDQLIIGAGSGNDVDHALRHGVGRIDAVEIDPAILRIGMKYNPDRPYDDPRVVRHLDDGRHFLRTTDRQYDAVVYALVDSLILHSSYANLRLESYLFTEQALMDVKRVLKPGGVFVTYNYFRQGWVVQRVAAMSARVFGCEPVVISLPWKQTVSASASGGFTMIIAGCNRAIADAFAARGPFWLNETPPLNEGVDGFTVRPETMPAADAARWQRIAPSVVEKQDTPRFATDDWPFLYLVDRMIPDLGIRSMLIIGLLGIAMVWLFLPKGGGGRIRFDTRMFFLGAAFMLLETKAIVQLALLFGSTWFVNSMVFFVALVLVLLANLFVLKGPPVKPVWLYAGLLALLAAAIATPFEVFLGAEAVAAAPERIEAARASVAEALALIERCHPVIAAEIRSLVCELTLFDGKVIGGSTDVRVFGNMFLRLPDAEEDLVAYYADQLVHEAGHLYLNALMAHDKLILNDDGRTYPAPTRADPRPLFGILHATFILARLAEAFEAIAAVQSEPYAAKLETVRRQFAHGVATLRGHGRFTALGAALQDQFEAFVDPRYSRATATV